MCDRHPLSIAEDVFDVVTASAQMRPRATPKLHLHASPKAGGSVRLGVSHHARRVSVPAIVGPTVRLRCLIVDDNASFRAEIRGLFEEESIEVVACAASAGEAVEHVAEPRPNLVLVDIDLGGESGLELARRLAENASGPIRPHVILISTHDPAEYAGVIESSRAVGFLAKTDLSAAAIRRLLPSPAESDAGARPSDGRPGT
jgi:CheY-like chemotaxis protein